MLWREETRSARDKGERKLQGRGDSAYRLHRHGYFRHRRRLKIEDTICVFHHQAVRSPVGVQNALVAFNRHGAMDGIGIVFSQRQGRSNNGWYSIIPSDGKILIHRREGSGVMDRFGGRIGEGIQVVVVRRWGWRTWRQGNWAKVLGSHAIEKLEENSLSGVTSLDSHALDWLAQRLETSCTEWVSGDLCPFTSVMI